MNPFATIRACAVEFLEPACLDLVLLVGDIHSFPIGKATPPFWPCGVCAHTQLAQAGQAKESDCLYGNLVGRDVC